MELNETFYTEVGEFITKERKRKDITAENLGKICGLSRMSIYGVEIGKFKTRLSIERVDNVLKTLGYRLDINIVKDKQ